MKDNFQAVLRGDGALHCNVDLGDAATMVAIKLAVESDRHSKTMRWDIEREKLVSGRGYLWRPWRC